MDWQGDLLVTLGTRGLPTLQPFYRSWGWTERDGGPPEYQKRTGRFSERCGPTVACRVPRSLS